MAFRILFVFLLSTASTAFADNGALKAIEKTRQVHQVSKAISTAEYTLPNGLKVFLTEKAKAPNVVVAHWVKAGSLHERTGITGIAHLFEHMMFRPLAPNAPSFFEIATKLGGEFNANTRFESTYFYTSVPTANLKVLLKNESDRFKKLTVTKELLDMERKAVWSEYSTKFDSNPVIDLWFQIYQQAYKGHPFGWMIVGERADLEKITAEDCNTFFKTYYRPNNTGLFITGNFKTSEVLPWVLDNYSDWEKGTDSKLPAPYNQKTKEIVAEGKLPSQANFILFGFRTPYFDSQNAALQTVAAYILFDSKAGLIKKRLVDEAKIAAEASEFNFDYDNGMLKAGIVGLPTTKLAQIKTEIGKVPDDFKKMSAETFEIYKRNLFVDMAESIQRNAQLAGTLALNWGKYGNIDLTSSFVSAPADVSKEQVQQFFDQYFKPNNFIFMAHKGQSK
jgi:zinc protease